jgi:hypothetical protein
MKVDWRRRFHMKRKATGRGWWPGHLNQAIFWVGRWPGYRNQVETLGAPGSAFCWRNPGITDARTRQGSGLFHAKWDVGARPIQFPSWRLPRTLFEEIWRDIPPKLLLLN